MKIEDRGSKNGAAQWPVGILGVIRLGFVIVLFSVYGTPAHAQIEEITVTAKKRETSLQETPIAISAFTNEAIQNLQIEDIGELFGRAPNINIAPAGSLNTVFIRGVGSELQGVGVDPSTALYLDGAYIGRRGTILHDFLDIARVEVLRGPQGTLYGRNSTAGTLNLYSNLPAQEFDARVTGEFGNFEKRRFTGMVNLPASDTVAVRLAALKTDREGFTKNINPDGISSLHDEDFASARASISYRPSENIELVVVADYQDQNETGVVRKNVEGGVGRNPAIFPGVEFPEGPREINLDVFPFINRESKGVNGTATFDVGSFSIKSISAYRTLFDSQFQDSDGQQPDLQTFEQTIDQKQFSQEFQLISNDWGNFEFVGGLYFLRETSDQDLDVDFKFITLRTQVLASTETTAYAIFGEGRYQFTDMFALTAGIRLSREEKSVDIDQLVTFGGFGTPVQESLKDDWDSVTPRVVLEWKIGQELLLYAGASKGFKSGGFNSVSRQGFGFAPEDLWAYEVGLKSTLLENRMTLNIAGFYYDYTNLQVQQVDTSGRRFLLNAAEATLFGGEIELVAQPIQQLDLSLSVGLLSAKYDEFEGGVPPVSISFAGHEFVFSPDTTANFVAQYKFDLGNVGNLSIQGEATYRSHQFFTLANDIGDDQDAYTIGNAKLIYNSESEKWRIVGYVNNISDKLYAWERGGVTSGVVGLRTTFGAPRTYGIEVGYTF